MSEITTAALKPLAGMKFLLEVEPQGMKLVDWITTHQQDIMALLDQNGALLIRGLKIHSSKQFGQLLNALFDSPLLTYSYRSTPRTELANNVYTATEYPQSQLINQHNENAYANVLPRYLGFCALSVATQGGETPISDASGITQVLTLAEQQLFADKGIEYVRNYSTLDLPWQEVFQTENKAEVEQYCRDNDISYQWYGDDALRTTQVNPAFVTHPLTGQKLWVNQAHLFHVSALPQQSRETLLERLGELRLPRNAYYGDGSPIDEEVLAKIRQGYEDQKVVFGWQKHDLLLLDNLRFTHGRMPFEGNRKVLVGMHGQYRHQ